MVRTILERSLYAVPLLLLGYVLLAPAPEDARGGAAAVAMGMGAEAAPAAMAAVIAEEVLEEEAADPDAMPVIAEERGQRAGRGGVSQ